MKAFLNQFQNFIQSMYRDERIPARDRTLIKILTGIILIRIFFIPDWIPYFGLLDVLFLCALICDYFFHVLDQMILLSHYPWGMKSFAKIKRVAGFLGFFAPDFIKDNLWVYTKDPF